ncbi:MAG: hypothetical protein ACRCX2_35910 [Paraclostridium sp.]
MGKTILSLKSKLSVKSKIPVFSSSFFKKNTFKIKFKNTVLVKCSNVNKLVDANLEILNCKSNNFFKTSFFNNKIRHSKDGKMLVEFKINNNLIIENITEFKKIASVFFELFNQKNEMNISRNDENLFHLLKKVDNKIVSLNQFRAMKLEEIFDEEFVYFIKNNI